MRTEEKQVLPLAQKYLSSATGSHRRGLSRSHLPDARRGRGYKYDALFTRIVNLAPPPIGLGRASVRTMRGAFADSFVSIFRQLQLGRTPLPAGTHHLAPHERDLGREWQRLGTRRDRLAATCNRMTPSRRLRARRPVAAASRGSSRKRAILFRPTAPTKSSRIRAVPQPATQQPHSMQRSSL
jgi:hypothetical protein